MKNYFLLVKIIHYMAGKFDGDDVDAVTGCKCLLRLGLWTEYSLTFLRLQRFLQGAEGLLSPLL